jgi:hypothetical protein
VDEIYNLHEQKQKAWVENVDRDELRKHIADISAFLQLIENVTLYEN